VSNVHCSIPSGVPAAMVTALAAALLLLASWPAGATVRLPPPTPGRTANATPTDGRALVRVPGTAEFVALTSPRRVPIGTRFDTRAGAVKLTTAVRGAGIAVTTASGAIFTLRQSAARASTELTLKSQPCEGGGAAGARRPPPPDRLRVQVRASRKHVVRVAGRYSIAGSRGTAWMTVNGCARTVTRVSEGVVTVRDLVAKRTIRVRAGHRPPRLRCRAGRQPPCRVVGTGAAGEYTAKYSIGGAVGG
jgi:hypothetical protein